MLAIEFADVLWESATELIIKPVQGAGKKPPKNKNANKRPPIHLISLRNGTGRMHKHPTMPAMVKTFLLAYELYPPREYITKPPTIAPEIGPKKNMLAQ